jgi:phage portal protein BeeE
MGITPADMNLEAIRRIPEERISGLIGIPAIVAGLGAGLDRSTFANMAEAREHAYEGFIIPTQQLLAQDLNNQLLPDMGTPAAEYVAFDLTQVRVLQEDNNAKAKTIREDYNAGLLTLDEARAARGWKPDLSGVGDQYKKATTPAAQPERDVFGEMPDMDLAKALTNGNGVHKQIA